jgi:hypothetical protein
MQNETLKDRQVRKSTFIARATKHFDSPELRKEAAELFEKSNPLPKSVVEVKIGNATYIIELQKNRYVYQYSISRKERSTKPIVTSTVPREMRNNIKMYISETVMQQAFYEVNREIEKLDL